MNKIYMTEMFNISTGWWIPQTLRREFGFGELWWKCFKIYGLRLHVSRDITNILKKCLRRRKAVPQETPWPTRLNYIVIIIIIIIIIIIKYAAY